MSLIPGSGRSPGERIGNPLQYSWLENPMNRGAWWAIVHGVTKQLDTTWLLNNNKINEFSWAWEDSVSCPRSQNLPFSDWPGAEHRSCSSWTPIWDVCTPRVSILTLVPGYSSSRIACCFISSPYADLSSSRSMRQFVLREIDNTEPKSAVFRSKSDIHPNSQRLNCQAV